MRVGIVAGEHSGDLLGAALIEEIRSRVPEASFEGIAGPRMVEAGCQPIFPMDKLSVMGLVEVLGNLLPLLSMRRKLGAHFVQNPPDVFIGIDAPDFNIGLEGKLKQASIPVIHYVSPSVWAWRRYRLPRIERSVDQMLTLFPFEAAFYRDSKLNVDYVGHPLADQIPFQVDKLDGRRKLGIDFDGPVIALLPGSRVSEVGRLAMPFIETAAACLEQNPQLRFLVPLADRQCQKAFSSVLQAYGNNLPVSIITGKSHEVISAADVVLTASGTATLESLLFKRPMVVAYKMAPATHFLAKRMVDLPYYSLPNLLAGQRVVPEFIQAQVTPENLAPELMGWLTNPEKTRALRVIFDQIHKKLSGNASARAARVVCEVVGR